MKRPASDQPDDREHGVERQQPARRRRRRRPGCAHSAATIVISGTIDRSWNSRIEKARSPNGVRSRPADCSIGSTCAVEDSASGRPSASAAASENRVAEPDDRR